MTASQFRDGFYELCPPWLRTGNAEKYLYSLELMRDLLMEKCNQAVKIRLPGQGHISQIPYLAFDRQLIQGPLESDDSFILRLRNAIPTWNKVGSSFAVLGQLKAYTQGIQPTETRRKFVIVSNPRLLHDATYGNTWFTVNYDDAVDADPVQSLVPQNFNWDGLPNTWRNWLVIFQYLDAPQATGSSAALTTAGGGSFEESGQLVAGVWVPTTSGTPINAPFVTVTGLTGLLPTNVGSILTLSGSANPENNGRWQIAEVLSATSCVIVNPDGVVPDAGPLAWSLGTYPWIPPGPAWGTADYVWGYGEDVPPDEDTGSNVRGTWKPTTVGGAGKLPSLSWGLDIDTLAIATIRGLVKQWKSAGTYYPNIIIAYDGPNGAYSRLSDEGTGNPDGSFGSVGELVDGVWVPTRAIVSPWDCYCQETGVANACSEENIT